MKKFFTLLLMGGAALTVPVMAQEEDMTHLIVNAGFDEDLTFQADGSTKPIVSVTSLSTRSDAHEAEDGTVYARSNGTGNNNGKKRSDGRIMDAIDGFNGVIKGWTLNASGKEWMYFGSVAYGVDPNKIPISDDNNLFLDFTEKPEEANTEDNIGALYMRAGWTNSATYSQEVKLPTAEYRLEYWAKNINPNTKATAQNLSKVEYRNTTFADEGGFNDTEWTKHTIEFIAVGKMKLTFGFKSANAVSTDNPYLVIDDIRLYKIGDADEFEVLQGDASEYADKALALAQDSLMMFEQAYYDIYDEIAELQNSIDDLVAAHNDIDALNTAVAQLKDMEGKIRTLIADANKALEIYYYIQDKILPYYDAIPGYNDLNGYFNGINMAQVTAAEIPTLADEMKEKLAAFWQSQSATREQPAIYSYLVSSPWFCKPYREPANRDAISEAGLTSEDLNSDGWVVGSQSGDQHKLYWAYDRTAFQLWNTNFSGYLDVHQELTGLPNGVYSLEADLVTNANARSDQHIYATSTLQETKGYMTDAAAYESWQSGAMPEDVPWETVQTAGTVIVMDGKLTIGARSTQQHYNVETGEYDEEPDMSSGARRGSFWMTNFVLRYHGEATPDEIAAAVAARLEKATTLKDAMHFAADKASVADSIAEFNATQNVYALNGGIALAETSEAKYVEIMSEGKTIPTVRDSLANEGGEKYGIAYDIVKYAYDKTVAWVEGQEATYAKADSILNVMKGYSNAYAAVCSTASKVLAAISSEQGKNAITSLMADQKSELLAGDLLTPEAVDKMVKSLNNVLEVAQAQDTYEKNKDNTDFTSYIKNAAGESADGWTVISKGNGPTNSSEYYNNNESGRKYFDSWAAKDLDFTVEQVINNLPNGTYAMKAAIRTDRTEEGSVKLFTANGGEEKADTTYYMVPNQWKHLGEMERTDGTINPDSVVFCSNIYGAIWEAVDPICREHISEATEEQLGIWNANGGIGFGWQWINISDIKVENHKLVIGFTSNSNRTGVAFTGSWFSVADFSLTLLEKGDNTGWDGPITGISETPSEQRATAIDGIYTLSGARVQKAQRGLYIIVQGGKSRKVIMK